MKRVIIVGGGYAGTGLARRLDRELEVRLIEPRQCFVHNIGAMRAVVEPALLQRIVIPYDRLLRHGQVVQGAATAVLPDGVCLADGSTLEADLVVVATGSRYAAPFKPRGDTAADFIAPMRGANQALRQAKSVAIVGAGPVGIELAGEISNAFPGKGVTLISRSSALLEDFNPALGGALLAQLRARGVRLIKGAIPAELLQEQPFGPTELPLGNGETLRPDLVFVAAGTRADNRLLRGVSGTRFDGQERAMVDRWLRLPGTSSLFALGDAAVTGDPMTAIAVTRQVPWMAALLKHIAGGGQAETHKPYAPWWCQPLVVPLGRDGGATTLPLSRRGVVFGPWLTSRLKGRELLVAKYRKEMGYPADADDLLPSAAGETEPS